MQQKADMYCPLSNIRYSTVQAYLNYKRHFSVYTYKSHHSHSIECNTMQHFPQDKLTRLPYIHKSH